MKVEEAIRIKETYQKIHSSEFYGELMEADRLSIEALKRCQLARKETSFVGPGLLPGETKD